MNVAGAVILANISAIIVSWSMIGMMEITWRYWLPPEWSLIAVPVVAWFIVFVICASAALRASEAEREK